MRILLTILLFCFIGSSKGQIINASAPYRQLGCGLLLDCYPNAAAAYSLRKLRTDYTGAAIRVRKDTTGQPEQDIGFVNGNLDTASLKSFIGSNSAMVTKWYSQIGISAFDASNTTAARQPRIMLNGVIDRENGKPTVIFDGNDRLITSSTSFVQSPPVTFFAYIGSHPNNTNDIFSNRNGGNGWGYGNRLLLTRYLFYVTAYEALNYERSLFPHLATGIRNSSNNLSLFQNGTQVGTVSGSAGYNNSNTGFSLGANAETGGPGLYNGRLFEVILYESDQSSNRTGIESNINSFYAIY